MENDHITITPDVSRGVQKKLDKIWADSVDITEKVLEVRKE